MGETAQVIKEDVAISQDTYCGKDIYKTQSDDL